MLPIWAIAPAVGKLITESFRHPNQDKVIVVDKLDRTVEVVPATAAHAEPPEVKTQTPAG